MAGIKKVQAAVSSKWAGSICCVCILFLICIFLFITLITDMLSLLFPLMIPLTDEDSILMANQFCAKLTEVWQEDIEKIKGKYEARKQCAYENNDRCTIYITCEGEKAKVMPYTLELYTLVAVAFNYDIQSLGHSEDDAYQRKGFERKELEAFIESSFSYLNPSLEENMKIERKILQCNEGERIGSENERSHSHEFALTNIHIELKTIYELLEHLKWKNEKVTEYNEFLNELLLELSYGIEAAWKANIKRDNHYGYILDNASPEKWRQDRELTGISRLEFTDMVSSFCIPKGKIKYRYGAKNPTENELDCSGFTSYMFDLIGVDIRQGTANQWICSSAITLEQARPGDLVFKQLPGNNGINHVGIYLGEEKFAHCASGSGTVINSYKGFIYYRRPKVKFTDDLQ